MNAQVKKEIRLLLPSWVAALLLALAPLFLPEASGFPVLLAWFGLVMMAVNSAGREFSMGTFSPLLAQPWPRARTWWTKVSVLALAQLIVFSVWCAIFSIHLAGHPEAASDDYFSQHALLEGWFLVLAVYSGGLWTTLLFRQMAPAFLMTLLVPVALLSSVAILMDGCSEKTVAAAVFAMLGFYAVAGFWWARRLFMRAQDVGWTGGTVSLPAWPFSRAHSDSFVPAHRRKPIAALFWKELQLHQLTLACAGALLTLHFISIFMRMAKHKSFTATVALESFWCLWLIMPVIVGCTVVAEERKLGVAEGQLCLPVSSRVQFTIKFLLAVVLGTLLGGVLPCLIEGCAIALGAPKIFNGDAVPWLGLSIVASSLGLATVAFFASTLARNFLQALATAVVAIVGCAAFIVFITIPQTFFGITLWRYFLADIIGVPTMMIVLVWLAYRNFKEFHESRRLWRRNLVGLTTALAFIVVASAALYNRIWEIFTPLEPPHGTARLALSNPPRMRCHSDANLTILLPDGRVWLDEIQLDEIQYDEMWNPGYPSWRLALSRLVHPLPGSLGPHQFIGGSNWVDVTARWWAIMGIRSDGSLWIAEKTNMAAWLSPKLARVGDETNWRAVAQAGRPSALLLKKDGTLWCWGTNLDVNWTAKEGPRWPGLKAFKPYRVDINSDWAQVFSFSDSDVYARKNDGTVWTLASNNLVQATAFGQTKWRSLVSGWNGYRFGVRDDGTLWICTQIWTNSHWIVSEMVQVGRETDWTTVAATFENIVALKSDGSLWKWDRWDAYQMAPFRGSPWKTPSEIANTTPKRLGIHNDWVAVTTESAGLVSLAADGSLWYWPDKVVFEDSNLLKISPKPELLSNIFDPTR
jgi:hypothetical protein